ncbi:hypothetical protein HNR23_002596 [Nocardiopsis mwathae]|uniref:DUF308 domain-containing protein n=1 Tax=Nocardiopsis mwathae TaxID=1472723 RepID=A0A7X0D6A6_9ACTN|nr:hypothetical protein [Nocardiopsis mwathae]MBB6172536.1 hypothetical protein [Nocardiopsis mwathae]
MTQRRGNGLLADSYVPLLLLPPATADRMLDVLGRSGIAAYALPLDGEEPDTAALSVADLPTDHLFVDAEARDTAAAILRRELPDLAEHALGIGEPGTSTGAAGPRPRTPETPGPDRKDDPDTDPVPPADAGRPDTGGSDSASPRQGDEAVWADLVARFYDSEGPSRTDVHWPDAENLSARDPRVDGGAQGGPRRAAADSGSEGGDGPDASSETDPDTAEPGRDGGAGGRAAARDDDSDHYIPPPPPPFPRGDLVSRLSWGGLFGGPLLLLGSMLIGVRLPGWLAFCAVAAFIAGFVVLVVRMGDRPSGDNGPDDGAVV